MRSIWRQPLPGHSTTMTREGSRKPISFRDAAPAVLTDAGIPAGALAAPAPDETQKHQARGLGPRSA
jgi:hypothetical protein